MLSRRTRGPWEDPGLANLHGHFQHWWQAKHQTAVALVRRAPCLLTRCELWHSINFLGGRWLRADVQGVPEAAGSLGLPSPRSTEPWFSQLATYQPLIENTQRWINRDGNHSQERAILKANPSWLSKAEKTL